MPDGTPSDAARAVVALHGTDPVSVYLSVFAHEYGHHVQAQAGILSTANKQRRDAGPKSVQGLAK